MGMNIFLVIGWHTNRAEEMPPTHAIKWNNNSHTCTNLIKLIAAVQIKIGIRYHVR